MESEAKAGRPQQPRGRTVFPARLAPEGKQSRPPNAASSHMGAKYGAATSLRSCCAVLGDQDGWGTNRLSKAESILGTGMSQNLSRGRRHACQKDDWFGLTLAAADLDADGSDDLLVAAPYDSHSGMDNSGAFFILYGARNGFLDGRHSELLTQGTAPNSSWGKPLQRASSTQTRTSMWWWGLQAPL